MLEEKFGNDPLLSNIFVNLFANPLIPANYPKQIRVRGNPYVF